LLFQMIFDGEGHGALETCRCQDLTVMSRVCEPLDDRAETLRHAGGRIADAVVIDEKKPHD
jgi:hypothetical protein